MQLPTLPPGTSEGLGSPGNTRSVTKALVDGNSTATETSGFLKRKAYALDEPEAQPYPLRTLSSGDDEAGSRNIKKEPGTERTIDSPPIANVITERIYGSKQVSELASPKGADVERSYTHISGFTPVNGRVSREYRSIRAGQPKIPNSNNQGFDQAASKPNIECLTENDVGMSLFICVLILTPTENPPLCCFS